MNSRDFCFWLQGWFELNKTIDHREGASKETLDMIEKHLELVFLHDIDPSMGNDKKQEVLNEIHNRPDYMTMTEEELDEKYGKGVRPRC